MRVGARELERVRILTHSNAVSLPRSDASSSSLRGGLSTEREKEVREKNGGREGERVKKMKQATVRKTEMSKERERKIRRRSEKKRENEGDGARKEKTRERASEKEIQRE